MVMVSALSTWAALGDVERSLVAELGAALSVIELSEAL